MEATKRRLKRPKYGGHKRRPIGRGRKSWYSLTEKPKRPKYGGHEKRLERPKYEGHTKEEATREGQSEEGENPAREKLGTEKPKRSKYGGHERGPERPKYRGHERRPIQIGRNLARKNPAQVFISRLLGG